MSDKPILFSAPMVRALLAGHKTQTRRVAGVPKIEQQANGHWHIHNRHGGVVNALDGQQAALAVDYLPIQPGDRLWVRETCSAVETFDGADVVWFEADAAVMSIANTPEAAERWVAMHHYGKKHGASVPSIHMPRWASRLTLHVTDVRVERLQAISEDDAMAEGVAETEFYDAAERKVSAGAPYSVERLAYADLWSAINGHGSWDANPWVVAYTFTVERCNIDQVRAMA